MTYKCEISWLINSILKIKMQYTNHMLECKMYNAARRAVNEWICQAIWTVYLNADENLISPGQFLSETKQY